jgi:formamidopyrimidine-DNA glycosylase
VAVHHPDVLRTDPDAFASRLRGRRVEAVERRAKNIVLRLDDGVLVVNLGMTGWLAPLGFPGRDPPEPTHPALTFSLDGGAALVYDDVRRFGCVEALDPDAWQARSRALGPEPLEDDFTPDLLGAVLARSRSPLRSWLLDQRKIAGVGNIYACEAAWRARVHPQRPARTLTRREVLDLHRGIVEVLRAAVRAGGTTIRDYRNAEGGAGEFASRLEVYGREGETCRACGVEIERIVFGNRSAFLCPSCQR